MYSVAGHRWHYGACALHDLYPGLQIHTLSLCNIYCSSAAKKFHERFSMLRYTYIASLLIIYRTGASNNYVCVICRNNWFRVDFDNPW